MPTDFAHCTGIMFESKDSSKRIKCPKRQKCKRYHAHKEVSKVYANLPSLPIPYIQPMYNFDCDSCEMEVDCL